jgi:hypothetical protein
MDEITQDDFVNTYPSVVFPPEYVLEVPKETMHGEKEVYNATCGLKRELCVGSLTPEQKHAFKHCSQLSFTGNQDWSRWSVMYDVVV